MGLPNHATLTCNRNVSMNPPPCMELVDLPISAVCHPPCNFYFVWLLWWIWRFFFCFLLLLVSTAHLLHTNTKKKRLCGSVATATRELHLIWYDDLVGVIFSQIFHYLVSGNLV